MASKAVSPALFIGLGEYGAQLASECLDFFCQANPHLTALASGIGLRSDGSVSLIGNDRSRKFDIPDLSPGNYKQNAEKIAEYELQLGNLIESELNKIKRQDTVYDLRQDGVELGRDSCVLVLADSFDSVGSGTAVPFLALLHSLQRIKSIPLATYLYLLLPELSRESDLKKKRIEEARSFAFFKELDFELELAFFQTAESLVEVKLVWIVGDRNTQGIAAGGIDEVSKIIANVTESVLAHRALGDFSFDHALRRRPEGCGCFYSSFGSSRIVFPEKEAGSLLGVLAITESVSRFIASIESGKFDRSTVFQNCRNFLRNLDLTNLGHQLSVQEGGQEIFKPFVPLVSKDEKILPVEFFSLVEKKYDEYDREAADAATIGLQRRSKGHFERTQVMILKYVKESIDNPNQGLAYCEAFLSTLVGIESEFLISESLELPDTISAIEEPIRDFYKRLLGIDLKEAELSRVEEHLKEKNRFIEELNKSEKKLDERIARTKNEVDRKKWELDKERVRNKVEALGEEVLSLTNDFEKISKELGNLKSSVDDVTCRRRLREEEEEKCNKEIDAIKEDLVKTDEQRRATQRDLAVLREQRRKLLQKLFLVIPISLISLALIVALILLVGGAVDGADIADWFLDNYFWIAGAVVAYALAGSLYYWVKVGKRIREAKRKLQDLTAHKFALMVKLGSAYNSLSHARWIHNLHSEALAWIKNLREWIDSHSRLVREFRKQIRSVGERSRVRWEETSIPQTLLVRSVVTKEDLRNFHKQHPLRLEKFLSGNSLSQYYEGFVQMGNISQLTSDLEQYSKREYEEFTERSVESFLMGKMQQSAEPTPKAEKAIVALHESAAPLVNLANSDRDKPQELEAVLVREKEDSIVPSVMARRFSIGGDYHRSTGDKNSIEIDRFMIGFPICQIAPIRSYREAYEECVKNGMQILSDSDRYERHPLFPSALVGAGDNDELVKTIVLARQVDIIVTSGNGVLTFQGLELGRTTAEIYESLLRYGARKVRETLEASVEKKVREDLVFCLARIREFLKREASMDRDEDFEKRAAKNILQERSPLG
jgi:hypothetical protein